MSKQKFVYILIFSFLVLTFFSAVSVEATDCPHGLINDPAPGACGLYIDNNNDNICDLSETEKIDVPVAIEQSVVDKKITENTTDYYMWQITLVLTVIYFLSLWLVRKKYISASKNYKIWNFLLLITFIITAVTSIFVLLRLNYGITFWFPLNLIYWHVQIGYIMLLISIYHTFWHLSYYKSYFGKK